MAKEKSVINLLGGKEVTIENNVSSVSLTFSYLYVKDSDCKFKELYYDDLIKLATALLKSALTTGRS